MDERTFPATAVPALAGYLAFISYSSVDREQALWLHRELEAYRVPKHLVSLSDGSVPVPDGLRPIFFDRLELAASGDLPRSIQQALRDSKFLIVLCSPHACRSRWVNEEVLTFKRLGRAERILPLIVGGVPDAKSRGVPEEQECFPPALIGTLDEHGNLQATPRVEPLAADLRPEGDKREHAKLKVIAGLLGVGFDDLVQREVRAATARARHARMIANRVQRSQSLFLASLSRQQSELGRTDLGMKIALEALPKSVAQPDRPLVASAEDALYYAVAHHRFDRDLPGGRGELRRVLLSPLGDRAITLDERERVTLWDVETGEVIRSFEDVDDYVGDVAFSPCGDVIAIAVSHMSATYTYEGEPVPPPVHIMDARSGAILTSFGMPDHQHSFLRFAPDGQTLLAACGQEALFVQVSATSPATTVFSSRFAAGAVTAEFHPAGDSVALVNKDGYGLVVRFSPAASSTLAEPAALAAPAAEIPLGASKLVSLTFNQAGDALVGLSQRGELWLFDPISGAMRDWHGRRGRDQAVAARFAAADPERIIVITRNGTVEAIEAAKLDASAFEVIAETRPIKEAYFAPDRRTVLLAFADGGAEWRDLIDRTTRQPPLPAGAIVVSAAFPADGDGGGRVLLGADDGHARVWSRYVGEPYGVVGGAVGVAAATLSADGSRIAAGTEDGDLEIWDATLTTRVWKHEGAHGREITRVAFHPESRHVASASEDGTARVWTIETGERVAELNGHTDAVDFVSYSKDGALILTAGRDGTARLWESETGTPVQTFRIPDRFLDPIHAFNQNHHGALTADGGHLVTVTAGDFMMVYQPGLVWDVREGTLRHALRHEGAIYHISLEGGDRWVLTTSYDHTAKLWDLETGRLLRTFSGHQAPVITGVVYADGKLLATASQDATARIWDVESGRQIAVLPHDEAVVTAVALDDGERLLGTTASDGCLRVWSSRTGSRLWTRQAGESPLVRGWYVRGGGFVSLAKDGDLRVWQLPPRGQALIDQARQRVQREGSAAFTREQRIRFFLESP